jgi:hypothetical protein
MAEAQKDTIYIDIDDEITTIIDKLQNSSNKVVALVLPKRASALQSVVNMKLLKRAAEQAKKNLVLVTTEPSLMPLAAVVGLHVAKTPNSRPEIPAKPAGAGSQSDEVDEIDLDEPIAPPLTITDNSKSVGDLAAARAMPVPSKSRSNSGVETLELDNTDELAVAVTPAKTPKPKKNKKLAVPNFNKFRLLLALGAAFLLILIVGGYFAIAVLPKAEITIKTNASNINTDVDFTLSTATTTFSQASKTVPAKSVQSQKTLTGSAPATGQKNSGDKATGSVAITAGSCSANVPDSLPSGSGISANGKTYITQERTSFTPTVSKGKCTYRSSEPTEIKAQSGGESFNTASEETFKVAGRSDLEATGSAEGGTDDIQTVVSQSDIDTASGKISSQNASTIQSELTKQLDDMGLYPITTTFSTGEPATTTSNSVGDEASNVTVTQVITYSMLGANIANIRTLVDDDVKEQIDTSMQGILNQGITQAAFKVRNTTTNGATINMQTIALVGPSLDTAVIAEQAAGKKGGQIKSDVASYTGVTEVEVTLSPFWVSKAPSNVDKITVTVAKPINASDDN